MAVEIALVGCGGLGVTAALGLAAHRPRGLPLRLVLFDPDAVELSNLNRQVLFTASSLGTPKADSLRDSILSLCEGEPGLTVESRNIAVTAGNIGQLEQFSFVLDCTDSTSTKFLLNDFCIRMGIPFCYAGAVGKAGQMLLSVPKAGAARPCLRCLFPELDENEQELLNVTCRSAGILGPVAGYLGSLQAEAVLASVVGAPNAFENVLTRFSFPDCRTEFSTLLADPSCPLGCASKAAHAADLRDRTCPSTFLYTKFALERVTEGSTIEVHFGNEESVASVLRTVREEGFSARFIGKDPDARSWRLLVTKQEHWTVGQ